MTLRLISCLTFVCALSFAAPSVYAQATAQTAAEPPPPDPIDLSFIPSAGPDLLYLEVNSLKTGKTEQGTVTADVWTFLALGAGRNYEGVEFFGAWSRDYIDCATSSVANGKVLHLVDASGKVVRTITQDVVLKPLAANSLYTYITGRVCGGRGYASINKDSIVRAMAWSGMPARAANAPLPPVGTVWHLGGENADMNVAFATDKDARTGVPLLYAHFSLSNSRTIVGSYYQSSYGYLTALEYDCATNKARSVYATYFNILHAPADSNSTVGEWKPFSSQGLAAQVLQSVCKTGALTTADTFTGDGKAAQKWLFERLRAKATEAAKAPAKAPAKAQ